MVGNLLTINHDGTDIQTAFDSSGICCNVSFNCSSNRHLVHSGRDNVPEGMVELIGVGTKYYRCRRHSYCAALSYLPYSDHTFRCRDD